MGGPLSLRPISAGDEAFLYQVYATTRDQELALVDWTEAQKAAFLRMQFEAQHRFYLSEFPSAAFDLIVREGQPIGRLYVDRRADEIRILDIALLPEHRCAGLGTQLLCEILAEADRAGLPVRIHVECFNRALALYERLGFRHVGDTGVHYLMERPPCGSGANAEREQAAARRGT